VPHDHAVSRREDACIQRTADLHLRIPRPAQGPSFSKGGTIMGDWLTFEKMITPVIIRVIFWVVSAIIVLAGIVSLFAGEGFWGFIRSVLIIVLGPLAVRIYCEIIMVFFSINDHLREIRDNTRKA
jgi:Domain of unknown function (DUF4282)